MDLSTLPKPSKKLSALVIVILVIAFSDQLAITPERMALITDIVKYYLLAQGGVDLAQSVTGKKTADIVTDSMSTIKDLLK